MPRQNLSEVELVQNAALGSGLIWRFGTGYQERAAGEPPPLLLAFLVLPICLYSQTLSDVLSTRRGSGLSVFAEKVANSRENLLAIHPRALAMRTLTFESIGMGVGGGLLTIAYSQAALRANHSEKTPELPERVRELWEAADRLGFWCGAISIGHISSLLQMDF
jgi:Family of unknown function (DUF6521)